MALRIVDIGIQGNDGTGDSIRDSFSKVNDNFKELYAVFGIEGTIDFRALGGTPDTYGPNQVIISNSNLEGDAGQSLIALPIVGDGDGTGGGNISVEVVNTGLNKRILVKNIKSGVAGDAAPKLSAALNTASFPIGPIPDPTDAELLVKFNNAHGPGILTSLDQLPVSLGYANTHYLKVDPVTGGIIGSLIVRAQPASPPVGVSGYDQTLTSNYLSTETMQRKDIVYRGGDTMTGKLTLSDHPSPLGGYGTPNSADDLQAASKFYVDNNSFSSSVNLYVATSGDDIQTRTPPGKEGRFWQYAYRSVGAAALAADNLLAAASQEPGPYRQRLTYTITPDQYYSTTKSVTIASGNSDQEGYVAAYDLLLKNKEFIQQETIAYINNKYVNSFTYDPVKYRQDIGFILNSVADDLVLGTTYNSTYAGSLYLNDTANQITSGQLVQTVEAINFARDQIINFSYNTTATRNYVGRVIDAVCYDMIFGSNFQSIQVGLYFPDASTDLSANQMRDVLNDMFAKLDALSQVQAIPTARASISSNKVIIQSLIQSGETPALSLPALSATPIGRNSAKLLLLQNVRFIQAELVAYLSTERPGIVYNKDNLRQNVEYAVWSLAYDILYGGNSRSIYIAQERYYENSVRTVSGDELNAVLAAFGYLKIIARKIIANDSPEIVYQQSVRQYRNETYLDGTVADTAVAANIQAMYDIINNLSSSPATVSPTVADAPSALTNLRSTILDSYKSTYVAASETYVNTNFPVINNQPTLDTITQLFKCVTDTLELGLSNRIPSTYPDGIASTSADNARKLILLNAEYIKAEVVAYLFQQDPTLNYDPVKCQRDIQFLLEAICFDLTYSTNSASTTAARQYWNAGVNYLSELQQDRTLSAYSRALDLTLSVISKGNGATLSTVPQVKPSGIDSGADASGAVSQLWGRIYDIVDLNPAYSDPANITEVDFADYNSTLNAVRTLILNNSSTIAIQTTAFLDATFTGGFAYDEAICYRDVGYIIDGMAIDLITGGNFQSVAAGTSYYRNASARAIAIGTQLTETLDAINFAKTVATQVLDKIVANRYQSLYGQITTIIGLLPSEEIGLTNGSSTPTVSAEARADFIANMDTIVSIIQNGFGAAPEPYYGTGIWSVVVTNGGKSSVDQGSAGNNDIIPAKVIVGVSSSAYASIVKYLPNSAPGSDTLEVRLSKPGLFKVYNKSATPTEAQGTLGGVQGEYTIRIDTTTGITNGMVATGTGISARGATVTLIEGNTVTLNKPNTGAVSGTIVFGEELEFGETVRDLNITIFVESGIYYEDYPIKLPANVSIKGDEFRRTIIRPRDRISQSPWRKVFFYRDAVIDGMQLGPLDTSTDYATETSITLGGTSNKIVITLGKGQVPADWIGRVVQVSYLDQGSTAVNETRVGKAIVDSVSGNFMNCIVIYPFYAKGVVAIGDWQLYGTINYGRHYLTNILDVNSTAKNNKDIDVFLCNDAVRISNMTFQGHGGFAMVLDPTGQIKTKSPYGQVCSSFSQSINQQRFAGGQFADGFAGRLRGTVTKVEYDAITDLFTESLSSGSDYTPTSNTTTYANVPLTGGSGIRATANITVTNGGVSNVDIVYGGEGYRVGDTLSVSSSSVGGTGSGFTIEVKTVTGVGNGIQITVVGEPNSGLDIRAPQPPCAFYVQGNRYQVDDIVSFNASTRTVVLTLNTATPFNVADFYDNDKCSRDVGLILEAVTSDAVLGTNFLSRKAGIAYTAGYSELVTNRQLTQTLAGINKARDLALAAIPGTSYTTLRQSITDNIELVKTILAQGEDAADPIVWTRPTGIAITDDHVRAQQVLQANKEFIKTEITAWLSAGGAGVATKNIPNYNAVTCARDVGYIVDAITHDLFYGGNSQTKFAVEAYFRATTTTVQAGSFVIGTRYKIASLGTTTQLQWNAIANTTGVTYAAGKTFVAATVGASSGNGTAYTVTSYILDEESILALTYARLQTVLASIIAGNSISPSAGNREIQTININTTATATTRTTATISGSSIDSSGILTVGTISSGTVTKGMVLTGAGIPVGTYINDSVSGSGAGSKWQTSTTTAVSNITITGVSDIITVGTTAGIAIGDAVRFTGTPFGGLAAATTYYVTKVVDATTFAVGDTYGATTDHVVTTASGSLATVAYKAPITPSSYVTSIDTLSSILIDYVADADYDVTANTELPSLTQQDDTLEAGRTAILSLVSVGTFAFDLAIGKWQLSSGSASAWAADTYYTKDTKVSNGGNIYIALIDHVSSQTIGKNVITYLNSGGELAINIEMGGNKSMLANDFAMINDLGYAIVAKNGAVSEQVSTFSYYCHTHYWAADGGQIRSVAGSNAHGNYGLRASGYDVTEKPDSVVTANNFNQVARVYKLGIVKNEMTPTTSKQALAVWIIDYDYAPTNTSELQIDHSLTGDGIVRYEVNSVEHTSINIGNKNVLKLNLSTAGNNGTSSKGLYNTLYHGQIVEIRTLQNIKFFNIDNVNPTRPSTALQYSENLSDIYRVIVYNLAESTGELFATNSGTAILGTDTSFAYYKFVTDVTKLTTPDYADVVIRAEYVSGSTASTTIVVGSLASVGNSTSTTIVKGMSIVGTGIVSAQYITAIAVNTPSAGQYTLTLSGKTSAVPSGTYYISNYTYGSRVSDTKLAVLEVGSQTTIDQVNKGTFLTTWNGRVHRIEGYVAPQKIASATYYDGGVTSTTMRVSAVSGTIQKGDIVTGETGIGFTNTDVFVVSVTPGATIADYTTIVLNKVLDGTPTTSKSMIFGIAAVGYLQISANPVVNISGESGTINSMSYQSVVASQGFSKIVTFNIPYTDELPTVDGYYNFVGNTNEAYNGYHQVVGALSQTVLDLGPNSTSNLVVGMQITGNDVPAGSNVIINDVADDGRNITVSPAIYAPSGASLTASLLSTVTIVNIISGGSGYSAAPIIKVSGGYTPGTGKDAYITCTVDQTTGAINKVTVVEPGYGYTTQPAISITPSQEVFEGEEAELQIILSSPSSQATTVQSGVSTVQMQVLYDTDPGLNGTCSQTVSNNLLTLSSAAGISTGDDITFTGTSFGGITAGTTYYVKTVDLPNNQITVAATLGGTTLTSFTSASAGTPMKWTISKYTQGSSITISSFGTKTGSGPYSVSFTIPSTAVTLNAYYKVSGNSNPLYNGFYKCTTATGTVTSITLLYTSGDPGTFGTGTTIINQQYASATNNSLGFSKPFSLVNAATLRLGYPAGTAAQVTTRISTCRATGHDFLDIGTGSYSTTNYPYQIYGNPAKSRRPEQEIVENGVGRVFYVTSDQNGIFRVGRYFTVDQGTGTVTFAASIALSNLDGLGFKRGVTVSEFSTDTTMANNAPDTVPTQSAVRGYIDKRLGLDQGGGILAQNDLIQPGFLALNGTLQMKGNLNLADFKLTNVGTPVISSDGANKSYVDLEVSRFDQFGELADVAYNIGSGAAAPAASDIPVFIGGARGLTAARTTGDISSALVIAQTTTLATAISAIELLTVIEVTSVAGFTAPGYVRIGTEVFYYATIDAGTNRLTGVIRSSSRYSNTQVIGGDKVTIKFNNATGNTPAAHSVGAAVVGLNDVQFNLTINSGAIVDSMVSPTAAIAQSKLAMNKAKTLDSSSALQSDLGLASFDSANFEITNGWVGIKESGVSLNEVAKIAKDGILGNITSGEAHVSAVSTGSIVSDGNGIKNSSFTSVGVMTVTANANSTTTSGVTNTNGGNTYAVVPITTSGGPDSLIKTLPTIDVISAGNFITGTSYTIISRGSGILTDFTLIGSANNTVGTVFVAIGPGTGTGTASAANLTPGYINVPGIKLAGFTSWTVNTTTVTLQGYTPNGALFLTSRSTDATAANTTTKLYGTVDLTSANTTLKTNSVTSDGTGTLTGAWSVPNASSLKFVTGASLYTKSIKAGDGGLLDECVMTGTFTLDGTSKLQATYSADLAEFYEGDAEYEPGTVLVFGGDKEVTTTNTMNDTRVAGVVSTDAAYMMYGACPGLKNLVALQGRVPCKVIGRVKKGDLLTTSATAGYAVKANDPKLGSIIGKALEDKDYGEAGVIEVAVGRM